MLREITDAAILDDALRSQRAIIYKHSTTCPISADVIDDVLSFARAHPNWKAFVLRVVEHRELSATIAERLGVAHESPQAFVIKDGRSVWHASHYEISADALNQQAAG